MHKYNRELHAPHAVAKVMLNVDESESAISTYRSYTKLTHTHKQYGFKDLPSSAFAYSELCMCGRLANVSLRYKICFQPVLCRLGFEVFLEIMSFFLLNSYLIRFP